ncbi:hypothetical protein Aple_104030 [Acrocarpospora pleiomorpha]|uniref:Uncharacterized protein n=1 Tax=Acrocarpospora pleiomorpha TaxID=90975 RepID=A0A5M3Y2G8_9ACTN|nr:hypothetical protein Aple_104030 [Acrocarpospora pleiomorpha]
MAGSAGEGVAAGWSVSSTAPEVIIPEHLLSWIDRLTRRRAGRQPVARISLARSIDNSV